MTQWLMDVNGQLLMDVNGRLAMTRAELMRHAREMNRFPESVLRCKALIK
jgi:hypothetical protein